MKKDDVQLEGLGALEREIGGLFDTTAPALDDIQLSRMSARAAAVERRSFWTPRVAAIGALCAGLLITVVVLGTKNVPTPTDVATTPTEKVGENSVARAVTSGQNTDDASEHVPQRPTHQVASRRLPPELGEVGNGVSTDEVRLAMGTYLDMDFEGDGLDFDDWDGDSEGLTEEELLHVTKDLLRNGS